MSYWRDWPPAAEPVTFGQARFYWATGSAYASAGSLRRHFADTARQAAGLSRHAPTGIFRLQGHVMAAEDILAMWTVEWVIHQLDLTAHLPGDRLAPRRDALTLALRTLDDLTGGPSARRPGRRSGTCSRAPGGCRSTTASARSSASARPRSRRWASSPLPGSRPGAGR